MEIASDARAETERLDHLVSRGKHLEAARVFLDYSEDVDAAVDVLCRGIEFSEAYRIVSLIVTLKISLKGYRRHCMIAQIW